VSHRDSMSTSDIEDLAGEGPVVALGQDFSDEVEAALRKRHPALDASEDIEVSGEIAHGHALLNLSIENDEATERLALHVCVECEPNDIDNPLEARDAALDYMDVILADFLDNDRRLTVLPTWDAHDVSGTTIKVRGEVTNPTAERAADDFLAEHGFAPDGTPTND